MRGLFSHLALRWRAHGSITGAEAKALLRTMRAHRHAVIHGAQAPVVPRLISRRIRPVVLWALFRVSVETPGVFGLAIVAIPATVVIGMYRIVERIAQWVTPYLSYPF